MAKGWLSSFSPKSGTCVRFIYDESGVRDRAVRFLVIDSVELLWEGTWKLYFEKDGFLRKERRKLWPANTSHKIPGFSHSFKPWEDGFSKGLYLAGVECVDNAEAPEGWTKWIIPSYEYIVVESRNGVFEDTIGQMNEEGISLVGAVHDYTDPATGKGYMYFPIREV